MTVYVSHLRRRGKKVINTTSKYCQQFSIWKNKHKHISLMRDKILSHAHSSTTSHLISYYNIYSYIRYVLFVCVSVGYPHSKNLKKNLMHNAFFLWLINLIKKDITNQPPYQSPLLIIAVRQEGFFLYKESTS